MTEGERAQEESSTKQWAADHKSVYLDLRTASGFESASGLMGGSDISTYQVVPLGKVGGQINFGVTPKTDMGRLQFIRQRFADFDCRFYVISASSFAEITKLLDAALMLQVASGSPEDIAARVSHANGDDIFRLLAQQAYNMRSSDIHIEPKTTEVVVRFRIDGALHQIMTLPFDRYKILLSSLQTKGRMTWGSDRPQGGRIDEVLTDANGQEFTLNIRLESIPTLRGEEIIARLLVLDAQYLNLDSMSMIAVQRQKLEQVVSHLNGMILTVGPTNSGKTSLLYAIINKVNTPEIKVVTLEDPIEYELPSTSQIPVNADDNELFAEKLRAVLRQDPNVIMLGEIRDIDTAKTALQAALTGHLVLSTFHANTAAAAISRLMDMIGHNPLLPSSLRLIIAKRLVRKVCDQCPEQYQAAAAQADKIRLDLKGVPASVYQPTKDITLTRGKGCNACSGFGYKGRISLLEMLEMTAAMEALVVSDAASSTTRAIATQASKDGMITMLQDGLVKALGGITTVEEVYRAVEAD